ncbi:MAG: DUF4349 domain-containing protein [Defluviitaleaceae bacterium]|nr:DUF4349 domain-containing protein [Defluviitaleaceae bacterium]
MRIFAICIIVAICFLLSSLLVSADQPFRQTHRIEIEVECIQTASEIIRELNGYNLESTVFFQEHHGRGPVSWANFTRRVDAWAFRHVQAELRSLGDVHSESEQAQFLGAQITDLDVRLAAIGQEIDRLTILMASSDTLDLLLTIESRLNQLAWERNDLIGHRNVLVSHATSPVITIQIFETPIDPRPPEPVRFGERVGARFSSSWRNIFSAGISFFIFLVRISVPLIALSLVTAFAVFLHRLGHKLHREKIGRTEPEDMEGDDETEI